MEFYRLTIPIPKRPWLWIRFRITTILLLITILAVLLAWRRDHARLAAEIERLNTPWPRYQAIEATGAPNVSARGDSSTAWCPATSDGGAEWLVLNYDESVVPQSIVVHENYDPGGILRITHYPVFGKEEVLWEGTYTPAITAAGSVANLPINVPIKTNRIKVYLDTAAASGWQEIDAVGLVDGGGVTHWATGAKASSTWNEPAMVYRSGTAEFVIE